MTYSVGGVEVIHSNTKIDWDRFYSKPSNLKYGTSNTNYVFNNTGSGSGVYTYEIEEANTSSLRLKITYSACACVCDCITCFPAGSKVMVAGKEHAVNIEDIKVGDKVIGAGGEINTVLALDHTILGDRLLYNINGEHYTTGEHPHLGADKKFYMPEPEAIKAEWGNKYPVILKNGKIKELVNRGITDHSKLLQMFVGTELKTFWGKEKVRTMVSTYSMPNTPLYNLVLDGSHTYFVDGYAVTGWPRDDDFDYDNWKQIKKTTLKDY